MKDHQYLDAELQSIRVYTDELKAEIERLQAALDTRSRSDGVLLAIVFTLNGAGVRDYEENPITEINVLQGVRRLVDAEKG